MRKKRVRRSQELLPAGLPALHALLAPAVVHTFETLQIGATLRDEREWHALHWQQGPVSFELAHGRGVERNDYNERVTLAARRSGETQLGEHAGMFDLFVPIVGAGHVHAVIITGPFARARPTSADILERWHWITGRQGHPSDPEFAYYVEHVLDTLVLQGEQFPRFCRLLECFALLCSGQGDARSLAAEIGQLRAKLEEARILDRMSFEAWTMVDERQAGIWLSPHKRNDLTYLGLSELPEHVIVGLLEGSPDERDSIDEIVRTDAFQRAAIDLARRSEQTIAARAGAHGVMFLVGGVGSGARARRSLGDLANRAAALARRRFGLSLHLGTSALGGSHPLSVRYEQALAAAERAASQGMTLFEFEGTTQPSSPLRQLRRELAETAAARPRELAVRFERYVEAVLRHTGYRIELARAHLESGFERAAEPLSASGSIDPRSQRDLFDRLERQTRNAPNVGALVAAYRRAVVDLVEASEHPVTASRDQSLRRAVEYVHRHFAEPTPLSAVARTAGLSPRYFSRLFKQRERVTFERYVLDLRLERAKQLLSSTDLSVERVAELSGFRLRPYFHRVFKRQVGLTPDEFRTSERRPERSKREN